ncbi:ENV2 protein, partial [Zapornia atra]|nr:ENV2 protein [Zapornia atra]
NPLWTLMQATFTMINQTNPNITGDCWFCYGIKPPYYEGIATPFPFLVGNMTLPPPQCNWTNTDQQKAKLTLQEVTGAGQCIG